MTTRLVIALALATLALPAQAADLTGGNKVPCNGARTWTEAAGADSSAFTVSACGAVVVNTGTSDISVYTASQSGGTKGGLLRTIAATSSADCNDSASCGATWIPGGKYILDCASSSCTADVVGQ